MSTLTRATYSKSWLNPTDFPTIEPSETQVRLDLQNLWTQIKDSVNVICTQLESTGVDGNSNSTPSGASYIGVAAIEGVTGTEVQTVLESLKAQIGTPTSSLSADLAAHTGNTSNPHSVTASQVPASVTHLSGANVQAILSDADTAIHNRYTKTEVDTTVATLETKTAADLLISNATFNSADGKFTFTKQGGATIVIDTNLEKIPASMSLIERPVGSGTYYLRVTNMDGSYTECNVTALFNPIAVTDTTTIDLTITTGADGKQTLTAAVKNSSIGAAHLDSTLSGRITSLETVASNSVTAIEDTTTIDLSTSSIAGQTGKKLTASVKPHSIGETEIDSTYMSTIDTKVASATASASAASSSASNAASSATSATTSATNASTYAGNASSSATLAQSYAKGGTGSRAYESTDNAKYYKEQAAASALSASSSATSSATYAGNANTKAIASQSWAVGGTGTRQGEDTNNSKYWCEHAAEIVGGDYATKTELANAITSHNSSASAHSGLFATKQDTLVSGTNIKTINGSSVLGSGDLSVESLPGQTGSEGKILRTNGTDAGWGNVDFDAVTHFVPNITSYTPNPTYGRDDYGFADCIYVDENDNYNKGVYVAVGGYGSWYSVNGVYWNSMTGMINPGDCNLVAHGFNVFLAIGSNSNTYLSSDNKTWEAVFGIDPNEVPSCLFYENTGYFIIGTTSGKVYTYDASMYSHYLVYDFGTEIFCGAANDSGRIVLIASDQAYYSSDRENWVSVELPQSGGVYRVIEYCGDRFIIAGSNGCSAYSTDGSTWTEITSPDADFTFHSIAYKDGLIVAAGKNSRGTGTRKKAYKSTDGTSWTLVPSSSNISTSLLVFGSDKLLSIDSYGVTYTYLTENIKTYVDNGLTTKASATDLTTHTSDSTIHVTSSDKSTWNSKYDKPSGGIPDSDIASASTWNGKQDALVSGSNIKTVNNNSLLGSGNIDLSQLYQCTYGTTTFAQIQTALNAGKMPYVVYSNNLFWWLSLSGGDYYFSSYYLNTVYYLRVTSSNTWSINFQYNELQSNKVTSITSSSTDIQYPSAKCVYDGLATKSNKSAILTGTLTVAGWSNNTQTLSISGLAVNGYAYTVAPDSSDFLAYAEAQIYADDVTTADTITFHCSETPTSAIDVVILKVEVS